MRIMKHMAVLWLALAPAAVMAQGVGVGQSGSFGNVLVDAVDRGDEGAVNNLLKYGQYIDSRGDFGTTPLMRAAYRGNVRLAEMLIKAGASVNATDVGGAAPLHIAARQGHADMVDLLIRYNADVNSADGEGWTPLMRAANGGKTTIADRLLAAGANPDRQNEWGETALVYAIKAGDAGLVRTLMSRGANPDVTDADGLSARQLARKQGNGAVLEALDGPAAPAVAALPAAVPVTVSPPPVTSSATPASMPSALPPPGAPSQPVVTESRRTVTLGGGTITMEDAPSAAAQPSASTPLVQEYRGAASGRGYMLQLGAFIAGRDGSYRQTADGHWQRFQAAYGKPLAGLQPFVGSTPLEGSDQAIYRIRAGFIPDIRQAEGACADVRKAGGTCMVISPAILEQEQRSDVEERFFKETALASAARTGKDPELALREVDARRNQPSDPLPQPTHQALVMHPSADGASPANAPWKVVEPEGRTVATVTDEPVMVASAAPVVAAPVAVAPLPAALPETRPAPVRPQTPAARVPETVALLEAPDRPAPRPAPIRPLAVAGSSGAPAARPRVEVAEAIPVPLSEGRDAASGGEPAASGATFSRRSNTMVEITAFSSQNAAISYSESLKATVGNAASGLSVRVTSPLSARGQYYKLLMGPVSNEGQVSAICRVARGNGLSCTTMRQLGSSGQVVRANAYQSMRGESGPQEYWLMLGSFGSAEEARGHFAEVRAKNGALKNKQSRLNRQEQRRGGASLPFRLQAGPFQSREEADRACARLEQQDYFCTVI